MNFFLIFFKSKVKPRLSLHIITVVYLFSEPKLSNLPLKFRIPPNRKVGATRNVRPWASSLA